MSLGRSKYDVRPPPVWNTWAPAAPEMDEKFSARFQELVAASLAQNTWRGLDSVVKSVEKMAVLFSLDLAIPWSSAKCLNFTLAGSIHGWRASTIQSYIYRVASIHTMMELPVPVLTLWARRVIQGLRNIEAAKPTRMAVTPAWMKTLRDELVKANWSRERKRLCWAVCTMLFSGSFRSIEILPPHKDSFAGDSSLVGRDITLRKEKVNGSWSTFFLINLRHPKESKTSARKSTVVEVFEQSGEGAWFCPVKAFTAFKRVVRAGEIKPDQPVFRDENGLGYTRTAFNADIRQLLGKRLDYSSGGGIASHCFRAGK